MRYNVVIIRGCFRLEGLSCLRYDINEHLELGKEDMFHGRRSQGGVIGAWLYISGPKVYILDTCGVPISAEMLARRFTSMDDAILCTWDRIGFGEAWHSILP